ncbi:hypothetical protein [Mycobacterium sp. M23085]|uniref:hypothetical protein n=1 Tax=Mycobacterium sp. M23085 TaxID=3378087 RepID=UPI00387841CC
MAMSDARALWDHLGADLQLWEAQMEFRTAQIAGYCYRGQVVTPSQLVDLFADDESLTEVGRAAFIDFRDGHGGFLEDILDSLADELGLIRDREDLFSDQDFPKRIYRAGDDDA